MGHSCWYPEPVSWLEVCFCAAFYFVAGVLVWVFCSFCVLPGALIHDFSAAQESEFAAYAVP